jgi:hypothetical protein
MLRNLGLPRSAVCFPTLALLVVTGTDPPIQSHFSDHPEGLFQYSSGLLIED